MNNVEQRPPPPYDIDSPEATLEHAKLIQSRYFLRKIYENHYNFFKSETESLSEGIVLELGSGGGFLKKIIPSAITSDVVRVPTLNLTLSATHLPFKDRTVAAIVMINVFHHVQDVGLFLKEAERVLIPGGKVVMVEPAHTLFSYLIYKNFHYEPFDPTQKEWALERGGRMSMANDALPWIVFRRDREKFTREYPALKIVEVREFLPFSYILSGGVSMPQLLPNFLYPVVEWIERVISIFNGQLGLFMKIVVQKE